MIELVIAIVIIGVAISGVLATFNLAVSRSGDPVAPKQAFAAAEALLEEIELMPFTTCDPDDPNADTGVACATLESNAAGGGPEAGETRGGATPFDNVNDYNGYAAAPVTNADGSLLAGYSVAVVITPVAVGTIPAADSLHITVSVTAPTGAIVALDGYRTRYAPTSLP